MIRNEVIRKTVEEIRRGFVGSDVFLEQVMITLLAGGHLLLEDKPGVGKTTLATTLARTLRCSFGRVQFTPDTLPGDITGVSVYDSRTASFSYLPGPVMNQIVLADEINRTSPKTQASLLEAMEEGQVTVDGAVHPLPQPFFVIATQNPVEFSGTYPLPEAQLDRFLMRLSIGYPDREQARRLALLALGEKREERPEAVLDAETLLSLQRQVREIAVSSELINYLIRIVEATRDADVFALGASPRAMLALMRAGQAAAFLDGRDYCTPDDFQRLAAPVLAHRLIEAPALRAGGRKPEQILAELLHKIPVPVYGRPER